MSHRIAILGAGISGLVTAWFLKRLLGSHIHLTVIEKNFRAGGWIQTLQTEGFLFEQGPHSCRSKGGHETLALIEDLGLQDEILMPYSHACNRYLYNGQSLQPLPKHLWEIFLNPLTRGGLQALWRDWRMPKRKEEDESIQAFFTRRIGLSWTERLIDPFVSGIYAGDYSHLSLKSCFPLFDQWEQQQGSLLRGAWHHRSSAAKNQTPFIQKICQSPMYSFRKGMESLPRALARELKDCLSLGQTIHRLHFKEQSIEIHLENGESLTADQVISTLPAFALSSALNAYPLAANKLRELSYASVAVINIGFQQSVLPFKGFGYLVPSQLGSQVLGCVWDSCVFPQQNGHNQTRLTLMMGGSRHPEVIQIAEQELKKQALQALSSQMGIRAEPQVMRVTRAQHAIPQFEVGYSIWTKRVQEIIHGLSPHLILSGSGWTGVSINDCVAQAYRLTQQIVKNLKISP